MSHFSENLHISAMVQIGKLNTKIELSELAKTLETNDNILYIEHGSHISKGVNNKKFSKKKSDNRKYFYNQVTIHLFNSLKENKRVNVKVFNNGTIQMTGVNSYQIGETTIKTLLEEFNKLSTAFTDGCYDLAILINEKKIKINIGLDEIVVSEGATKGQLKKALIKAGTNKMKQRVILNQFVGQMAV